MFWILHIENITFLLLHRNESEEKIRVFFQGVFELYKSVFYFIPSMNLVYYEPFLLLFVSYKQYRFRNEDSEVIGEIVKDLENCLFYQSIASH